MPDPSGFHEGEVAVQQRAGEHHNAILNSRLITSTIMPQALPFVSAQPWAILGGPDPKGQMWCSALVGKPGFADPAPGGAEVRFDLRLAPVHSANPLLASLSPGRALGSLFIDLTSRRRLRVNGKVREASTERLCLAVEESFPNCPKFIQKRTISGVQSQSVAESGSRQGQTLSSAEVAWIMAADTLFLATMHPERGADASHRGGRPGFVEVLNERTLRLPDYPGNSFFQSFGNLEIDARMGMLIPSFETGAMLHLSGWSRVIWNAEGPEGNTGGTGRFFEFNLEQWALTPPLEGSPRWSFLEASPFNI